MNNIKQVQKEYEEEFCTLLEIAYGQGFLSEGGIEAIDSIVKGIKLEGKEILDIGSGKGGAAFYLAQKYKATVTGIEINQRMVDESNSRIPPKIKNRVKFLFYDQINNLPFPQETFEHAYSKGVFLHLNLEDKLTIFKEIFRVLKPNSYFTIGDWISPNHDHWGEKMRQMIKIDGLTIFANNEEDYRKVIEQAGFTLISIDNEDENYAKYNQEIVQHLKTPNSQKKLKKVFSEEEIKRSIQSYVLLRDSILEKELSIKRFVCKKTSE